MDVYYKNELLNDNKSKSPITDASIYGLEFSNGSRIIICSRSIDATCSNGRIRTNGSDKSIYATISLPSDIPYPQAKYVDGLLVAKMVCYDLSNT